MTAAIVYDKAVQEDLDIGIGNVDINNPGGGSIRGTRINLQSFAFATYSGTWVPGTVVAGGIASTTVSLPGVAPGDLVMVSFSSQTSLYGVLSAWVSAVGTVTVVFQIASGAVPASFNIASGTLRVLAFKTNL